MTTESDAPNTEPYARPVQGELPLMAPPAGEAEMLVPTRMVNEWVYCPRLAFLEWAQGEWAGNADTAAGQRAHRAAEAGLSLANTAEASLKHNRGWLTTLRQLDFPGQYDWGLIAISNGHPVDAAAAPRTTPGGS